MHVVLLHTNDSLTCNDYPKDIGTPKLITALIIRQFDQTDFHILVYIKKMLAFMVEIYTGLSAD